MSVLLRSYLKPLANDYLESNDPQKQDIIFKRISYIFYILNYGKFDPEKLTSLLAQFEFLDEIELGKKITSCLLDGDHDGFLNSVEVCRKKLKNQSSRCRRDKQSLVSKWLLCKDEVFSLS